MAFSTTSFFAGVGTVFAAVAIGFTGGTLITTTPKMELNRLERVTANNPPAVAAAAKAEKPAVPAVPVTAEAPAIAPVLVTNEKPEPAAFPDRIVTTAAPASPQAVPLPPQPVTANISSELDNAKKLREAELRKQAESQRRAVNERRKRQEIEAAVTAVKRMQRDGVLQQASQREETTSLGFFGETPRLGAFGRD